jgi:hypothetical protein
MKRFPNRVRLSTTIAFGALLAAISGCAEEPQVPAEVERLARQREEADERALDELERKRIETSGSVSSSKSSEASPPEQRPEEPPTLPDRSAPAEEQASAASKIADPPAVPVSPVVPAKTTAAMRWTQMKAGMTTDDVVALLGKPTRISSDVFVDYWTYGEGRTTGRVAFIRLSRMTIAWDPPVD